MMLAGRVSSARSLFFCGGLFFWHEEGGALGASTGTTTAATSDGAEAASFSALRQDTLCLRRAGATCTPSVARRIARLRACSRGARGAERLGVERERAYAKLGSPFCTRSSPADCLGLPVAAAIASCFCLSLTLKSLIIVQNCRGRGGQNRKEVSIALPSLPSRASCSAARSGDRCARRAPA